MKGKVVLLVVFSRAHTTAKAYQLSNPISNKTYSNLLEMDYYLDSAVIWIKWQIFSIKIHALFAEKQKCRAKS